MLTANLELDIRLHQQNLKDGLNVAYHFLNV